MKETQSWHMPAQSLRGETTRITTLPYTSPLRIISAAHPHARGNLHACCL